MSGHQSFAVREYRGDKHPQTQMKQYIPNSKQYFVKQFRGVAHHSPTELEMRVVTRSEFARKTGTEEYSSCLGVHQPYQKWVVDIRFVGMSDGSNRRRGPPFAF